MTLLLDYKKLIADFMLLQLKKENYALKDRIAVGERFDALATKEAGETSSIVYKILGILSNFVSRVMSLAFVKMLK